MAEVWASEAALAYAPLARHLVSRAPVPLDGVLALDAGAGTGAAGHVLREAGARVVAADLEPDMARFGTTHGPVVVGDVTALPFGAGSFGVTVAAFVINHLPDPVRGLSELRRVTSSSGVVLVSVFATVRASAKNAVDEVAERFGFTRPGWSLDLQEHVLGVGSVHDLAAAATAAGLDRAEVTETAVDVGLSDPAAVVRYRLGMPHLRRFSSGLDAERRAAFVAEATAAVAGTGEEFRPGVVEMVAIV